MQLYKLLFSAKIVTFVCFNDNEFKLPNRNRLSLDTKVLVLYFAWKLRLLFFLSGEMPVPSSGYQAVGGQQGPSCFKKLQIGFAMGAAVGSVAGVVIGGFVTIR